MPSSGYQQDQDSDHQLLRNGNREEIEGSEKAVGVVTGQVPWSPWELWAYFSWGHGATTAG